MEIETFYLSDTVKSTLSIPDTYFILLDNPLVTVREQLTLGNISYEVVES